MNLRSIDLNLLVVLDALLDEAHVSRAARRVGLSQPAASSALDRCRQLLNDRLLERAPGGMRLTPKAEALKAPLRDLLASVSHLIGAEPPPLAEIRQTVRIAMADAPGVMVAPRLYAEVSRSAPGLDLTLLPWRGLPVALDGMTKGEIDLAVSVLPPPGASFRRRELFREDYVVIMRRDHPAAANFDLDRWLAYPHVLVSWTGEAAGDLDETLARLGRARRVGIVVPSFLMVPPLLKTSDLIAMLPRRTLPADVDAFTVRPPPIPVEGFPLHIGWHVRRDQDVAVRHVADVLERLLTGL
jgi:DNA-binding transcriptional LysR family regulator